MFSVCRLQGSEREDRGPIDCIGEGCLKRRVRTTPPGHPWECAVVPGSCGMAADVTLRVREPNRSARRSQPPPPGMIAHERKNVFSCGWGDLRHGGGQTTARIARLMFRKFSDAVATS